MVHDDTSRLVGNLASDGTLVGVYYDEGQNRLHTYPVLGFASWEECDNEGGHVNNLYPIVLLECGPVEEDIALDPESDFLGVCKLSEGGNGLDLRKIWEEDIEILKSMRKAREEFYAGVGHAFDPAQAARNVIDGVRDMFGGSRGSVETISCSWPPPPPRGE